MPETIISIAGILVMPVGAIAALAVLYWFLELFRTGFAKKPTENSSKFIYVSRRGAFALWACIIFVVIDRISRM